MSNVHSVTSLYIPDKSFNTAMFLPTQRHLLYCREDIRCAPMIGPRRSENLVNTKFWVVDGVDDTFCFNDDAGMVRVGVFRASLGSFARNRQRRVENAVAGIDLVEREIIILLLNLGF